MNALYAKPIRLSVKLFTPYYTVNTMYLSWSGYVRNLEAHYKRWGLSYELQCYTLKYEN